MILLTWLDVKRYILEKRKSVPGFRYPAPITNIRFSWSGLDVTLQKGASDARAIFQNWFDTWFAPGKEEAPDKILLKNSGELPVYYEGVDEVGTHPPEYRPFWDEIIQLPDLKDLNTSEPPEWVSLPTPWNESGPVIAVFHSFKGGVSRTTHLIGCISAIRERQKELDRPFKILVIDGDAEAPGFSYWENQSTTRVSYIDFVEMLHSDSSESYQATIQFFARELSKHEVSKDPKVVWYVLPAFREFSQQLYWPIKPEHLVKGGKDPWVLSECLRSLGMEMGVDLILVDLRAGYSEMSSPLLMDPRLQRFLVTSLNKQSLEGTKLIIQQLAKIAPPLEWVRAGKAHDPAVIVAMVLPAMVDSALLDSVYADLPMLYPDSAIDENTPARLELTVTEFAQELLHLNGWDEAFSRLKGTSLQKRLQAIVERWLPIEMAAQETETELPKDRVRKLAAVARDYEYAEKGKGNDLLVTTALRQLALDFQLEMPNVVIAGSKGAGKTFTFLQLAKMQSWNHFCDKALDKLPDNATRVTLFPLLESKHLSPHACQLTETARKKVRQLAGFENTLNLEETRNRIKDAIHSKDYSETEWNIFWLEFMAKSLGFKIDETTASALNHKISATGQHIALVLDGLEQLFDELGENQNQKRALRTLLELPNTLRSLREPHIGLIIFIRRDLAVAAIQQNVGQFMSPYEAYELRWDFQEMLRLTAWLCITASVLPIKNEEMLKMNLKDLERALYPIWGARMGMPRTKEARTSTWIFSALSDYKNKLQARDLIRLLVYAAQRSTADYERRLLSPRNIKDVLPECSKKKVEEAFEEFPRLKLITEKFRSHKKELSIPFRKDSFKLAQDEMDYLEATGVITEHNGQYYIPEIYRYGLGFHLGTQARSRVLAFKKKFLQEIYKELRV